VNLSLDITAAANATFVAVAGEIDLANHGELERTLEQLGANQHHVELDLRGVTFIDSSGMAMLMRMREHCAAQGGNLVLKGLSDQVRRLFEVVGVAALFTIVQ
jgi:anti-anti-sigma factor